MKRMIRIIRRVDLLAKQKQILLLDQDYELGTLHLALERKDEAQIKKSKQRLLEIDRELKDLENAFKGD